ncbi:MAG TPA: peptidoglycan DD-metalloendopeptidase family protein [Geminicoccaceae bacterium]|nr:peptidoglycan DD-metalloendopeptidase family protein [Geminicoccus sp.]HMU51139.1 peptidoglycan DD-metalloendopeptidase family protein [Geminicoccaceae bacterium]
MSAATTFSGIAYFAGQQDLDRKERLIADLEQAADLGHRQRQEAEQRFLRTIRDMETAAQHQRETIERLSALQATLRHELGVADQQVTALTEERDSARELADSLDKGAHSVEVAQRDAEKEKRALGAKITSLEARLASLVEERDMARRTEKGLRWRMEQLEQKLTAASAEATDPPMPKPRRSASVSGQAVAIEKILSKAGLKIATLLDRADDSQEGTGGPFTDAETDVASLDEAGSAQLAAREQAMRRLVGALPLAQPMSDFRVMSGFGRRSDPISRRRAVHEGIDLSGDLNERVRATQDGTVVRAGRFGDYGIVVEVDHGMGIVTRYAHLKGVLVRKGEKVSAGEDVGIIGSTGRSTGRHLHYEIRLDGRAVNPAPFLEATKLYGNVLKG